MAIQDGITGIHNKRFFLEFLDHEISCAGGGHPLTLVMFDCRPLQEKVLNDNPPRRRRRVEGSREPDPAAHPT